MTSSAAPDLKPCPFCGGTALIARSPYASDYMAGCTECDMAGQSGFQTEENAIESWNTRADLAVKVKSLEWESINWAREEQRTSDNVYRVKSDFYGDMHYVEFALSPLRDQNGIIMWHDTPEDARSTAQADYETRILSALEFIAIESLEAQSAEAEHQRDATATALWAIAVLLSFCPKDLEEAQQAVLDAGLIADELSGSGYSRGDFANAARYQADQRIAEAERRGAERMRERAVAKIAELWASTNMGLEEAIRALPLTEGGKG